MPARSVDLPDFLAVEMYATRKRRVSSSTRSQPNNSAISSDCHGKRSNGLPANFPLECRSQPPKNSIA